MWPRWEELQLLAHSVCCAQAELAPCAAVLAAAVARGDAEAQRAEQAEAALSHEQQRTM